MNQTDRTNRTPSSTSIRKSSLREQTFFIRLVLSMVVICEMFMTESCDRRLNSFEINIFPGASLSRRLEVIAITITVCILLLLKSLHWRTTTGWRNPGPEPDGSGNSAHQISPRRITRRLFSKRRTAVLPVRAVGWSWFAIRSNTPHSAGR